jgi:hypothetical protein
MTIGNRQRTQGVAACDAGQIRPACAAAFVTARRYCEDAHQSEEGPGGSATLEATGGTGNQPSGRRNNAAAHFLRLDPDI